MCGGVGGGVCVGSVLHTVVSCMRCIFVDAEAYEVARRTMTIDYVKSQT